VFVVCGVGSGLCDELITLSGCMCVCVSVCETDSSTMRGPRPDFGCCATKRKEPSSFKWQDELMSSWLLSAPQDRLRFEQFIILLVVIHVKLNQDYICRGHRLNTTSEADDDWWYVKYSSKSHNNNSCLSVPLRSTMVCARCLTLQYHRFVLASHYIGTMTPHEAPPALAILVPFAGSKCPSILQIM
jgi:hypothetical protein